MAPRPWPDCRRRATAAGGVDLIVTDFHMPGMDGFELVRRVKGMEGLGDVPILLLTSAGNSGDLKQGKGVGIAGCLGKPIRRDKLLQAVESILAGVHFKGDLSSEPGLLSGHSLAGNHGQKCYRILLVEDYPTNQQVAMRHLEAAGLAVDMAENGEQAVAAFQRSRYDLILMDLQMPIMDGYGPRGQSGRWRPKMRRHNRRRCRSSP